MKNYYQILEVNENASPEIIEKAYRVLAKKYHPDIQPRDKLFWAEVNFKEVTEAYNVLSNRELRREYDMKLQYEKYQNFTNSYQAPNFNNPQSNQNYAQTQSQEQSQNTNEDNNSSSGFFKKKKRKQKKLDPLKKEMTNSIKEIISQIPSLIHGEFEKPPEERAKTVKALILTLIIVSIIIFIFLKVPFLRSLLFP